MRRKHKNAIQQSSLQRIDCAGVVALCLAALLAAASGCRSDHRISLARFLEMQSVPCSASETAKPSEHASDALTGEGVLAPFTTGPQDVLAVTVSTADSADLFGPVQARVDRNGAIDLPIVGEVKVANLELEDVERVIQQAYVPDVVKDVSVHVEVTRTDSADVLVVGAVTLPGLVELRRNERNLLFAIVQAGGVSELASGAATLRRIRRPTEEVTFNLLDPTELATALALDPLEDGDIVFVPAAIPNTIFVGGLVNHPAAQVYAAGAQITILQALAAAGGLRTDVLPREGTLIRRLPNGTDVQVKLNLGRLARGQDSNIVLAAGDILWVPETIGTRVHDFFNRNVFLRAGASINYNVTGVEYMNRRSSQTRIGRGNQQDQFDPLGFLSRNAALQTIAAQP